MQNVPRLVCKHDTKNNDQMNTNMNRTFAPSLDLGHTIMFQAIVHQILFPVGQY